MIGDIPISRLEFFRKEIGLDETKLIAIRPFADQLARRSRKAGKYLDSLFRRVVPRTRLELILEYFDGTLKNFWTQWYATLWTKPWDSEFLRELWQQGIDSAKIGIDLQYMMLGEMKCRQLFIRAVRQDVPIDHRGPVASAVNDLLDLCLMVRAKGHASYRARAAEPLLQGLFHQTRNPLTVIGGTAMRLMRSGGPDIQGMAQVILDETLRMERMTRDISTFNSVELAEPSFQSIPIGPFLQQTLEGLKIGGHWRKGVETRIIIDPSHPEVDSDPALLKEVFKEILLNALDALPPSGCVIEITTEVDPATPSHLTVSIFGEGELPRGQEVDQLFLPFNSVKPQGTGFGLPIAWAAARKCFGKVTLSQIKDGVVCSVKLPLKGQIDETGLLTLQDF